MAVPKPLLTEFGIYHRLGSCVAFLEAKIAQRVAFLIKKTAMFFLILQHKTHGNIFFSARSWGLFRQRGADYFALQQRDMWTANHQQ